MFRHVARCAYWALILASGLPELSSSQPADLEAVVVACVLHDMGLAVAADGAATSLAGISPDKRFEVDGANIARDLVRSFFPAGAAGAWDEARLDRLWNAIALHATPSIARHAAREVALAQMAIEADFAGPYWSPDVGGGGGGDGEQRRRPITMEQYRAVTALFPREGFGRDGVKKAICEVCRQKPQTTYDNFAGLFGREYGYDGKGLGREEYARAWEKGQAIEPLLQGLDALDALDAGSE